MEISIIIPALNESKYIGRLIDHLLTKLTMTFEIIVVDGGSSDNTVEICQQKGVQVYTTEPSRAIQQNFGAKHAKFENLYFVHADTLPPGSIQEDLAECIRNGHVAACYRSRYESHSKLLTINAFFTRFYWLVARGGDQSLFIRKSVFFELGGYDENFVIMEEYPLIQELMRDKRLAILPKPILISTRKYDGRSWLRVSKANYKAFKLFRKNVDSKIIRKVYKEILNG